MTDDLAVMSEPNWARILKVLHEGELATNIQRGDSFTMPVIPMSDLEKELNLEAREIESSLEYLAEVRLIEWFRPALVDDEGISEVQAALTPEGFHVAHERELRDRQQRLLESQNETSAALVMFTAILGAAASVQALASITLADANWEKVLLGIMYVLLLVGLYYYRDELFVRS